LVRRVWLLLIGLLVEKYKYSLEVASTNPVEGRLAILKTGMADHQAMGLLAKKWYRL
jgi:hypothetical protein